jgi:hypothetical protein
VAESVVDYLIATEGTVRWGEWVVVRERLTVVERESCMGRNCVGEAGRQ